MRHENILSFLFLYFSNAATSLTGVLGEITVLQRDEKESFLKEEMIVVIDMRKRKDISLYMAASFT